MKQLNSNEIHQSLLTLVREERKILNNVLDHLAEVNRRKLFLRFGHDSLLKYCVKELKYSESAAYRRIKALRITVDMPDLKAKVAKGELNLTQLCRAQNLFENFHKESGKKLNSDSKRKLLDGLNGKSAHDSENLIRERLDMPPKKRRITIPVNEETYQQWIKFKGFMVHKNMTEEMLLRFAIKKAVEVKEPLRVYSPKENNKNSRYIPASMKRKIFKEADYKCSHKGCSSVYGLEIDHIEAVKRGGKTEVSNLRLLCRHHNQARNFF